MENFYARIFDLACKGWGKTHPNPMVGAMIVEDNEVVAEGYHECAGSPHAEVVAFSNLGRTPREGASIFVSLEPCSTFGRTPPCTHAIIQSGIKKVLVCCLDPNPEHSGRGLEILKNHGIEVTLAPESVQARFTRLNFIFNHQMKSGTPLVALKIAETSNGMVAEKAGHPSPITEAEARIDMMNWRRLFPAICVGAGTVLADNPSLTARIEGETWCPVRLVVDSRLSTLAPEVSSRKLYSDQFTDHTFILTTTSLTSGQRIQRAEELGVKLVEVAADKNGRMLPTSLRTVLNKLELNSVYCEGGPSLAQSLLVADEIDYLFRYRSPKFFDSPDALAAPDLDQYELREPVQTILGEDRLTHGFL